jgi:hypothetical protein
MFAAKDRPRQDAAASSRPVTLAAPARISSKLRQDSQMRPFPLAVASSLAKESVFSTLRSGPTGAGCTCSPRNTGRNPNRMNTYEKCAANPCRMRTSRMIGLKVSCNEHLRKSRGGASVIVTQRRDQPRRARAKAACSAMLASSSKADSVRMLHEPAGSNNQHTGRLP